MSQTGTVLGTGNAVVSRTDRVFPFLEWECVPRRSTARVGARDALGGCSGGPASRTS